MNKDKKNARAEKQKIESISLNFKAFFLTDRGKVRKENQDAYYANTEKGLFIVCDGMGGHSGGAVAAEVVVTVLPEIIEQQFALLPERTEKTISEMLKESIANLSSIMRERTKSEPGLRGMGATMVLALVCDRDVYIAHIGDSRAYLFIKDSLKQLTGDHTIVAVLLELGQITPEQAKTHPARSRLSRYVGMGGKAVADVQKVTVSSDCKLLLCSDGLTSMLSDEEIEEILKKVSDSENACRTLVEEANRVGGYDNVTVMILEFSGAPADENSSK